MLIDFFQSDDTRSIEADKAVSCEGIDSNIYHSGNQENPVFDISSHSVVDDVSNQGRYVPQDISRNQKVNIQNARYYRSL